MTYLTLFLGRTGRPPLAEGRYSQATSPIIAIQMRHAFDVSSQYTMAVQGQCLTLTGFCQTISRTLEGLPSQRLQALLSCLPSPQSLRTHRPGLPTTATGLTATSLLRRIFRSRQDPGPGYRLENGESVYGQGIRAPHQPRCPWTRTPMKKSLPRPLTSLPCTTGLLSPRNIESTVRIWKAHT
jgi:hypothetical protein